MLGVAWVLREGLHLGDPGLLAPTTGPHLEVPPMVPVDSAPAGRAVRWGVIQPLRLPDPELSGSPW